MKPERFLARGDELGKRAASQIAQRIVQTSSFPPGVSAQAIPGGIRLTGRRLKQRYITDPIFRSRFS